jgi:hypothetical protein
MIKESIKMKYKKNAREDKEWAGLQQRATSRYLRISDAKIPC